MTQKTFHSYFIALVATYNSKCMNIHKVCCEFTRKKNSFGIFFYFGEANKNKTEGKKMKRKIERNGNFIRLQKSAIRSLIIQRSLAKL